MTPNPVKFFLLVYWHRFWMIYHARRFWDEETSLVSCHLEAQKLIRHAVASNKLDGLRAARAWNTAHS